MELTVESRVFAKLKRNEIEAVVATEFRTHLFSFPFSFPNARVETLPEPGTLTPAIPVGG